MHIWLKLALYLKTDHILLKLKKGNSSNYFLITVTENLRYLKIWSPFQPPAQKVILYPGKFACSWNRLEMAWQEYIFETWFFCIYYIWFAATWIYKYKDK